MGATVLFCRYSGCGLVVPEKLQGCKVLDLGSGSGRDCFILSKLVGQSGHVIGIDMTAELVGLQCHTIYFVGIPYLISYHK